MASDGVDFSYSFGNDLAISFYLETSGPITYHEVSFVTNFVSAPKSGTVASDTSGKGFTQRSVAWYFVTGLDVLARRLHEKNIPLGVVNVGINGNIVGASNGDGTGAGAVQRFDRDVLGRPGVRTVLIFEGTNDLGGDRKSDEVYADLRTLIDKAHGAGVCVVLGTLIRRAPWGAWSNAREAERIALNKLIRTTNDVEGIIDFEAALGLVAPGVTYVPDGVHPLAAAFEKMGNAVPLDALVSEGKSCRR